MVKKVENKNKIQNNKPIPKKNSQIHFMMNTEEKTKLMKKAKDEGIYFAEWCRRKILGNDQLDRIEKKIDNILHGNANS